MNSNKDSVPLGGKTLLMVHACTPKKKFVFKRIKQLGITLILLNQKEAHWAKPYVDHWIFADLGNSKEVMEKINEFKLKNPGIRIDGVVTFWEESVLLTSKICDTYNFIGIPHSISSKTRNKHMFRNFCRENNVKVPVCKLIKKKEELVDISKEMKFPIVIKPVYGSSSAFVIKVDNYDELLSTYNYICSNILTHEDAHEWDNLDILVEEYIDGDEVDIDMLIQNGKVKFHSITDNRKTREPFFVETGWSIPSVLPEKNKQDLVDMAEYVLEKLGVQNGCVHFEAKSTNNGPVPIEVNLRMGGDEVYMFIKTAWRVDMIDNVLKIAFGEYIPKIVKPEKPYRYLVSEDFLPDASGTLVKVYIDPELKKMKNVEQVVFLKEIGDSVFAPPAGYEYLGWMVASGDSLPDAQDNLNEARKLIDYDIAKFSPTSSFGKTLRKTGDSVSSMNKELLKRRSKIEKIRRVSIENQRKLRVGIACNIYKAPEGTVENELFGAGSGIEKTLIERGYDVTFFDFNNLPKVFNDLDRSDVDIVFNVCERINDSSLLEPHAASILDSLQIPYTGSSPFTLALCIDKIRVKKLLTYHEIPTPKWDYAYSMDEDLREDFQYPLIVKPANTDNSIGITNDSVVTDKKQLMVQMEKVLYEIKRPVLIEEYIDGDEYDVSILGSEEDDLRVLPLSRSIFDKLPSNYWHIYPFDAKFTDDLTYKNGITKQQPPKNISKKLSSLITEVALDTYNILDCHDYGRVEIRVDKQNNPYVLELNPNPSIAIVDTVPRVAKLAGMDYGDFLEEIIRLAIKRYKDRPPYYHLQSTLM